jgi:hypothetical protein
MFRRVVSLLVLFGFIAGQLAAVPHAHGGLSPAEQREHDARPHVHVGSHSHNHGHSHGEHSHSHTSTSKSPNAAEQSPARGMDPRVEHEADAVYLPCGVSRPGATEDQRTLTGAIPMIATNVALQLTLPAASAPVHHPHVQSPGTKVFLKLRNLRI